MSVHDFGFYPVISLCLGDGERHEEQNESICCRVGSCFKQGM